MNNILDIKTPALDHLADFATLEDGLLISLRQLERLRLFALDEGVRELIKRYI